MFLGVYIPLLKINQGCVLKVQIPKLRSGPKKKKRMAEGPIQEFAHEKELLGDCGYTLKNYFRRIGYSFLSLFSLKCMGPLTPHGYAVISGHGDLKKEKTKTM